MPTGEVHRLRQEEQFWVPIISLSSTPFLLPMLSPSLYRSIMLSYEQGSFSWATACLHKGTFHDSLCL